MSAPEAVAPGPPRPNLFIVGAPRSGTTTLHVYLEQHPEVFMSTPKEPHFFCGDIHREFDEYQGGAPDPLFRTEEQYLRLFEPAGDRPVRGESSVYYLYSEEAARRIHAFDPEARIVIMLREPIEFMRSLHAKLRWAGDEDEVDFARAFELEESRRRGEHLPSTVRFPSILFYSRYARFSRWIELYRDTFGVERVKLVLLDDFRRDTEGVYRDVLDYLGVSPAPLPARTRTNEAVEPRSRTLTRLMRTWGRSRRGGRAMRWLERLNTKRAVPRPLDDAVRRRMQLGFLSEVERLSELVDRDLCALWGYEGLT